MDQAVALVETYLRINGYLTVTEYPVVEVRKRGRYRTATDLDVLAFRFPGAGRLVYRASRRGGPRFAPDPELDGRPNEPDMIIAEVKEGKAELNAAATDPEVLQAALVRFGCCRPESVETVVRGLLRDGEAVTHCGHRVRLLAFGSSIGPQGNPKFKPIALGHVVEFLCDYLRQHWDLLRQTQSKDPIFGLFLLLQKAGGMQSLWSQPLAIQGKSA